MNTNHVICKNEVYIEDVYVGQFESFNLQATARTLGNTAVLTLPLYAIGTGDTTGRASARVRKIFNENQEETSFINESTGESIVKVCAQVEVYMWYESWNAAKGEHVPYEKLKVFSGFIEHIAEGFPAKLYLQDNSFILRFGQIEKPWNENATLQEIVEDCIPIAQQGFDDERQRLGFTRNIPRLTYSVEKKNVQAVTTSLSFRNWGERSPFDTIQKLIQLMVLYGGVTDEYNVFLGAGVKESDRPILNLDTRYNVVERDMIPIDGRFVDYDVKVTGILQNGKQYTATGGYRTSKSAAERGEFEKAYGESHRAFCTHNTPTGIQDFADRMLNMLRGVRNKGRIKTLLYPKLEIMDWVTYNDSVFPEVSGGYYVLGYSLMANEKGYFQNIEATDQVFVL